MWGCVELPVPHVHIEESDSRIHLGLQGRLLDRYLREGYRRLNQARKTGIKSVAPCTFPHPRRRTAAMYPAPDAHICFWDPGG